MFVVRYWLLFVRCCCSLIAVVVVVRGCCLVLLLAFDVALCWLLMCVAADGVALLFVVGCC